MSARSILFKAVLADWALKLLLLTATGSFGFSGTENGLLVGFVTASKVNCPFQIIVSATNTVLDAKALLLMGILPLVIRLGRGRYVRWSQNKSSVQPDMDSHSETTRLINQRDRTYADSAQEEQAVKDAEILDGSERFDLYFGTISFLIDALALVSVGSSRKVWQLYACEPG